MKLDTLLQQLSVAQAPKGQFAPSLHRSIVARAPRIETLGEMYRSERDYFYHRFGHNPTVEHVESLLAKLDGMDASLLFPSGMGAISALAFVCIHSGIRRAFVQNQAFDQTARLFDRLRSWGLLDVHFIDPVEFATSRRLSAGERCLLYLESPSNPLLVVPDVRALVEQVRSASRDSIVAVDSTLGPPGVQQLARFGVDVILHSTTKYLGGHNDHMGGLASMRGALKAPFHEVRVLFGGVPTADDAWLLSRSLKTHSLRVTRMSDTAQRIATFLFENDTVSEVFYPFVGDVARNHTARAQMERGGGLLSFTMQGGKESARRFCNALEVIQIASSMGGTATVVEVPSELDWSEDESHGVAGVRAIPPGLVRMSVGVEDADDLLEDIGRALTAAATNVSSAT